MKAVRLKLNVDKGRIKHIGKISNREEEGQACNNQYCPTVPNTDERANPSKLLNELNSTSATFRSISKGQSKSVKFSLKKKTFHLYPHPKPQATLLCKVSKTYRDSQ